MIVCQRGEEGENQDILHSARAGVYSVDALTANLLLVDLKSVAVLHIEL